MNILGFSAYYHDSAAALLCDGTLVAAAQEEAFSRRKHDASTPLRAMEYCLSEAGIGWADVDYVGYYELPELKLKRILATRAAAGHAARPDPHFEERWSDRLELASQLPLPKGSRARFLAMSHHVSHAASAFYPSPFDDAAILTVDGVGEYATTTLGSGRGSEMKLLQQVSFPHSLGLLYAAFTYYLGFKVNSGEYKLMGLAPYGEPRFTDVIERELVRIDDDGGFRLNMDYFGFLGSSASGDIVGPRFASLFGGPRRAPEEPLTDRHLDVARSIQAVLEKAMLALAKQAKRLTDSKNLCLAGGVALNCVANGRLLREGPFENIWIQPAASDAGGAVGAAYRIWHGTLGKPRQPTERDRMRGAYLGPSFTDAEIQRYLDAANARYDVFDDDELVRRAAALLAERAVVGWFQGRMEFGPRALGNRSILADPRDPTMQVRLNEKIKAREGFRPFAPAVLAERVQDYFAYRGASPYMLMVAEVAEAVRTRVDSTGPAPVGLAKLAVARSTLPAITHVDYSARLQTVHQETNPLFWRLLEAFRVETGCAVLVNTSFNVRGEPIVCTPEDAFKCFMRTDMDHLVMGHALLDKRHQRDVLVEFDDAFEAD